MGGGAVPPLLSSILALLLLLPPPSHPHAWIQTDMLRDPLPLPSFSHLLLTLFPYNKHGREI